MEDFGTILWIVIVVGIMVTNVVTKARKARGKGSEHSGSEAWPSADTAESPDTTDTTEMAEMSEMSDAEECPTSARKAATRPVVNPGSPMPRPSAYRPEEARNRQNRPLNRTAATTASMRTYEAATAAGMEAMTAAAPTASFGSGSVFAASTAAAPSGKGAFDAYAIGKTSGAAGISAASGGIGADGTVGRSDAQAAEEAAAIAEAFDLRRAVIYSEILKPKFEE